MDQNDPFRPHLERALNYSEDPFLLQQEGSEKLEPNQSPLTFHDRHISSNLSCRQVVDFPQIEKVMSKVCDDAIANFFEEGCKFLTAGYSASDKEFSLAMIGLLDDARNMNRRYKRNAGHFSGLFASKFFHPDVPWSFIFDLIWNCTENDFVSESTLDIFPERLAAGMTKNGPQNETIKEEIEILKEIRRMFPHIALWHFFPLSATGKLIVQQMASGRFRWEIPRTKGITNPSIAEIPDDARESPWSPEKHGLEQNQKPSQKKTVSLPSASLSQRRLLDVGITRKSPRTTKRRLNVNQYIQHAWGRAVESDSTFVVFNCGVYERIGIRHRASQTLYLSPLIDPITCRNPAYGKLHIGLHTAIAEDMGERFGQMSEKQNESRKRRATDLGEDPPTSKRVKYAHSADNDESIQQIILEMSERKLALITLKYGVYCSPAPATFFRIGKSFPHGVNEHFEPTKKTKFPPGKFFELVLDAPMGDGVVGATTHPATLSIILESGETLQHDLVVKFAFSDDQRDKLMNEYRIYTHLAYSKQPVDGIVVVHGVFEDQDSDTLALVMDHGGQSLKQLDQDVPSRPDTDKAQEILSCHRILRNIHKAGVRHRSIRPDNFLINERHAATIIDFSCAVVDEHEGSRKYFKELRRLQAVFQGKQDDPEFWASD